MGCPSLDGRLCLKCFVFVFFSGLIKKVPMASWVPGKPSGFHTPPLDNNEGSIEPCDCARCLCSTASKQPNKVNGFLPSNFWFRCDVQIAKKNTSCSFCFSGMFLFFPKVLRTMGSQDWWFGDPKPLLYTSKPQWLSGTRRFKVVYGGRDSHLQRSLNHPKKVTSRIWINLRIPNHRAPNQQFTSWWLNQPPWKICSPNCNLPNKTGWNMFETTRHVDRTVATCRSRFPQVSPRRKQELIPNLGFEVKHR